MCGSKDLRFILSLGEQYVTDFVDKPEDTINKGPLTLVLCDSSSGGCGLLQLKHTFNHDALYKKYWYKSGISISMVSALKEVVESVTSIIKLEENDVVLDIGSNDGTLLKQYGGNLIKIGFEPSNLWELGINKNTKIVNDYFGSDKFLNVSNNKKAKIITAIAMFYDLEDPNKFVYDLKKCLDENGIIVIQMNYLGLMLKNNTFDNISHEHLEYYSLKTLNYLLKKYDLEIFDVILNDVNGGSFRVYIKNKGSVITSLNGYDRVKTQIEYEEKLGMDKKEVYAEFAERIVSIKEKLLSILESEKAKGKKIFIYGASTRGLVILQFVGIDEKLISLATDKNKDKWGKYIAGTKIKIIPINEYRIQSPDYLFVLPYHFINEIMNQEDVYIKNGGKLIVAIPEVKIIP